MSETTTPAPLNAEAPADPLHDVLCPKCGYALRGLEQPRCPECGTAWTIAELTQSRIPWVHRRQIGFWRAYWATVWMATIRSDKLCLELHRPVSFDQARRFWLVTCTIASAGAILFVLGRAARFPSEIASEVHQLGLLTVSLILLCIPLGVVLLSAAPSLLLHPKTVPIPMQNRGVALSYYLCAPLSSWMLIGAFFAVFWFIDGRHGTFGYPWPDWVYMARLLLPFILALSIYLWWANLMRLSHRQTGVFGAASRVGVEILFLWVHIALLAWVILPFTLVHLRLILTSL